METFISSFGKAFLGGLLIGLSALLMLVFNGRILGVSGILGGVLNSNSRSELWRYFFFAGMLLGGVVLRFTLPNAFENTLERSDFSLVIAGVLVGWGTRLGSGCTSGHGICGVSRLSPRSLLATVTFMLFGFATVWFFRKWGLI
ncbi:YeeE/YedE family protein [bacterium]|nr:YeeE/YedE family protein [bacterium]NBX83206.1 YeeE/YedE family protein [bacterium]